MFKLNNFANEETFFIERKHWIQPVSQVIVLVVIGFFIMMSSLVVFSSFIDYRFTFLLSFLIILITGVLLAKTIIEWYFHCYIITNKRIMEISYIPILFSRMNGILLDQIRCTEVEEKRIGLLKEIFDIGDITIKFDSLTRSDAFEIHNIPNPDKCIGILNKVVFPQNSYYGFQLQSTRRNDQKSLLSY